MSTIFRRLVTYKGKTKISDFTDQTCRALMDKYYHDQEKRDPRIKQAEIKGTHLHPSHDDPTDPKEVWGVRFLDDNGKRVGTGHLHLDGTSKFRYKQKSPAESPSCGFEEVPPREEEGSGDASQGS